MQTRKRIQHWYMWILVDTLYIGLYIYKNLLLTAILYAIFLLMAIQGIIEWKKVLRTPTEYFPQKS
ncbi:MAG: nicotinamide mononucleotide transporter [bacterium]